MGHQGLNLIHHYSILIDPVPGDIGADVGPRRRQHRFNVACLYDFQQGTGLRVPLAKEQKLESQVLRQNRQIRLNVTRRNAGGYPSPTPATDLLPHFTWLFGQGLSAHQILPWSILNQLYNNLSPVFNRNLPTS